MSHTRVKTTYSTLGAFGSVKKATLYCNHNHSCDCTTFYEEDGSVAVMSFEQCVSGDDLYDAMERLWYPFEDTWGGKLKDKVEFYGFGPWENK